MQGNFLVNGLIVLIMIYVGRVLELVPYINQLSIGKIAVIIVFVLYLVAKKDNQPYHPIWSYPQGKYLVGITLLAILSIPGSVWQSKSFDFVFSYYFKLLIFVYLLVNITSTKDHLKKLGWSLALCSFVQCLSAIVVHRNMDGRLYVGGTYDPNDLALVLVMSLPIIYYLWGESVGLQKHLLLTTMLMSLLVIPQTGSRGGLLALIVVVCVILAKKGKKALLIAAPLIVVLAFFYSVFGKEHLARLETIGALNDDYNNTAQEGRIQIWQRAMKLVMQKPVLGSGVGAFVTAEGTTHESGKWSTAHNSFVQIAVELGVIGFILHVWVIWKMIQQTRRRSGWLSNGLEVGLYAYCVGGMFLSWAYFYLFYLFLGLSLVQAKLEHTQTINLETA